MTGWLFAAITFIAYILQTTVFCNLSIFGIVPDAVIVCVICYSILYGREKGFISALITGMLIDFLSGPFFGRHIISYILASVLASYLAEHTFGKNFLTAAIINLAVSLPVGMAMAVFLYISKLDRNIAYSLFVTAPVYALYNMLIGIFVFIFMEEFKKFSYRRE